MMKARHDGRSHADTTHGHSCRCFSCGCFWRCLGPACAEHARQAVDASALAFVNDIYDAYKGKDAKGHPLDDERAIRRYFEPSLAALMVKDQKIAAKRGEVGLLDFDPFIDAQDWEISDFRYRGRRHRAGQSHRHRQIHQLR